MSSSPITISRANGVSIEVDRDRYAAAQRAAGYFNADAIARRARSTRRCLVEVRRYEDEAREFARLDLPSDEWAALGYAERWADRLNELNGFAVSDDEHRARQEAIFDGFAISEELRRADQAARQSASALAA